MRRRLTPAEIKSLQMEILCSIHDFCVNNNIRYSLAYGTLLGAIRHKGYIPWDDDVDIMMPRPDYERFIKLYPGYNKNHTVQTYINDDSYFLAFAKVYDNRTELIVFPTRTGVFVDIFPVDGLPDSVELTKRYYSDKLKLIFKDILFTCKNNDFRPGNKMLNSLKYAAKRLLYPSRKKAIKKLESMIYAYPFESSKYAMVIVDYDVPPLPARLERNIYEQYITVPFEKYNFNVIKEYHHYLQTMYGDYMQLPPEEKRVPGHQADVYWKEGYIK